MPETRAPRTSPWRASTAFVGAAVTSGLALTVPYWGLSPLAGFRGYFANDQLSYAAIATNIADGEFGFVEPFTRTGTSHYPSAWYVTIGIVARATGQPVWATWQVLGVAAVMVAVAVIGWVGLRLSGRWWAPLLPAAALVTGTLAWATSGTWLTALGSHAVLWGPLGTLTTLNAEAVGVCMSAAALAVLALGLREARAGLVVTAAVIIGALANVQTYTFLTAAFLAAVVITATTVLSYRALRLVLVSVGLFALVILFGRVIADMLGPLPLFVLLVASLAPAAWPLVRRHRGTAALGLAGFAIAASPQLIRTALGLRSGDPFLVYRQASSVDLGVPIGPALLAALPLVLVALACAIALWRRTEPVLSAVVIALVITWCVLSTNDRWGFNQEPYRFWLQVEILGALLLSTVLAWALASRRRLVRGQRIAFLSAVTLALIAWAASAVDTVGWWAFTRSQGIIAVADDRHAELASLLQDRDGLVMSSRCTDPRVLKLIHPGPVAFYNAGLAWPRNPEDFLIFQDVGRRAAEDVVALRAARVQWVVTDAECSDDWVFGRGAPVMRIAAAGPWQLWRVE